jgi:hypothetical protein
MIFLCVKYVGKFTVQEKKCKKISHCSYQLEKVSSVERSRVSVCLQNCAAIVRRFPEKKVGE